MEKFKLKKPKNPSIELKIKFKKKPIVVIKNVYSMLIKLN